MLMMSRQRYMHFDPDLPSPVVLVADPDDAVRSSLRDSLATIGVRVRGYRRGADLLGGVESQAACVITELKLEDMTGIELLARLQERGLDLPVILLASDGDVETAVEAMQAGALDFIEKCNYERLLLWHVGRLTERGSLGSVALQA